MIPVAYLRQSVTEEVMVTWPVSGLPATTGASLTVTHYYIDAILVVPASRPGCSPS